MQTFTTKIVNMAKEAKLFASQGGPIILAQRTNMECMTYGEAGKSYVKWCAQMAVAQNTGVPWIMCQQSDAPSTVINTCNGFYCDAFTPNNPKNPKIWTENWTGWFKKWGQKDPHRTAEDLAFSVARFFQHNGVLQNYYMYHGGTNFGRTSGGPFITTSYDYDAPLDEYGNLNQPKWGHLKKLHAALKLGEKILTNSTVKTANYSDGWVEVNVQTSLIVKKLQENDTPQKLSWEWAPEPTKAALLGRGGFKATQLLEQKAATNDQSDYLWYMTRYVLARFIYYENIPPSLSLSSMQYRVVNNGTSMKNVTLRVKYSGQFLHAFVNGKEIGSQHDYSFTFEKPALLKPGRNIISLLSATVGLQSPVELIDSGITTDLSSNEWSYKVGLIGEGRRFYNPHSGHAKWVSGNLPVGSAMTWSLLALTADPNGCDGKCDYRGQYKENKCLSNCGNPTQRWYHVPRSFLNNGPNTLILFEEIGGNPSNVSFQITATETICGNAYEGTTLELSCNGGRRTISDIQFASFGDPQGSTCGSFQRGSVEASSSLSAVEKVLQIKTLNLTAKQHPVLVLHFLKTFLVFAGVPRKGELFNKRLKNNIWSRR
uniref:beta-galactosidase n=1 Tax=Salix viminalis TaxID=40686 RepID=A0A6N2M6V7_SALVM